MLRSMYITISNILKKYTGDKSSFFAKLCFCFLLGSFHKNTTHLQMLLFQVTKLIPSIFVCAMQVQTFHKVRGQVYASTMCIGNMRSAIVSLFAYFQYKDKKIREKAIVYFSVIGVFAIGAGLGSVITKQLGVKAIWVCCALLTISFFMMFIDLELNEKRNSKNGRKSKEEIKQKEPNTNPQKTNTHMD